MLITVATAAAAAPLAALPALAASAADDDAELLVLERELLAAYARMKEAAVLSHGVDERFSELCPPQPTRPPLPDEYAKMYEEMTVGEIALLAKVQPDHPILVWQMETGTDYRAKWSRFHETVEKLREENRTEAAEEAYNERVAAAYRIADRVMETPAKTMAGVEVKIPAYELLDLHEDADAVADAFESVANDIRAMAAQQA